MTSRVPSRFLATALLVAASMVVAAPGHAVDTGLDHLKCYNKEDSIGIVKETVTLVSQVGAQTFTETCEVRGSRSLCFPTAKLAHDGTGTLVPGHFVTYNIRRCHGDSPGQLVVRDQFGQRTIKVGKGVELWTPATAVEVED